MKRTKIDPLIPTLINADKTERALVYHTQSGKRSPLKMSDLPSHPEFAEKSDEGLFSLLPDDVLKKCFSFVGPGHYRYVGSVSKHFQEVYVKEMIRMEEEKGGTGVVETKVTFWRNVTMSENCAELCLEDQEELGRTPKEKQVVINTIGRKAAELGKVEVLTWTHRHGFEWDTGLFGTIIGQSGHVNVLEWAHSNKIAWCSEALMENAIMNGHVNILDFVYDKEPLAFDDHCKFAVSAAIRSGHIDVLEWLKKKQLLVDNGPDENFMNYAAYGGHVIVLDWLCENGYQPSSNIVDAAACGGSIDVLQWLQDQGIHGSAYSCTCAAQQGHLNALQWLRENDCPWDSRVIFWAAWAGHDNVVEWARENGCPEPAVDEHGNFIYDPEWL